MLVIIVVVVVDIKWHNQRNKTNETGTNHITSLISYVSFGFNEVKTDKERKTLVITLLQNGLQKVTAAATALHVVSF